MIAGRCRICPVTLCPSCMELRAQQHPTIIRLLNEPSLLERARNCQTQPVLLRLSEPQSKSINGIWTPYSRGTQR